MMVKKNLHITKLFSWNTESFIIFYKSDDPCQIYFKAFYNDDIENEKDYNRLLKYIITLKNKKLIK